MSLLPRKIAVTHVSISERRGGRYVLTPDRLREFADKGYTLTGGWKLNEKDYGESAVNLIFEKEIK